MPKARFLQRRPRAILTHATLPAPRAPGFVSDRNSVEEPVSQDPLWYKDAVFYELHVKAFHESASRVIQRSALPSRRAFHPLPPVTDPGQPDLCMS